MVLKANVLFEVIVNDRSEEAWQIVARLHNTQNGDESFAKEEFYQISQQVQSDAILNANETLWDLFRKPSYRKRMICGGLTMFSAMSTGILVVYSKIHTHPLTTCADPVSRLQCSALL